MTSRETKKNPDRNLQQKETNEYLLVLHNDEVHSFDYVIDALIDVCDHDYEQAVQCTVITHHNGSCDIRKGELKTLRKMKDALTEKELSTTINSKT